MKTLTHPTAREVSERSRFIEAQLPLLYVKELTHAVEQLTHLMIGKEVKPSALLSQLDMPRKCRYPST